MNNKGPQEVVGYIWAKRDLSSLRDVLCAVTLRNSEWVLISTG